MSPRPRDATTAATGFLLTLDGIVVGFVETFAGGPATADVVAKPPPGGRPPEKHLGPPHPESITFSYGRSPKAAPEFYGLLAAALRGEVTTHAGSIAVVSGGTVAAALEFSGAAVSGLVLPALDRSRPEAASVSVTLTPADAHWQAGSGETVALPPKQRPEWRSSDFRFEVEGVVVPAAAVRQMAVSLRPSIEFPNVRVTFGELVIPELAAWHEELVIQRSGAEKAGSIAYLSPGGEEVGGIVFSKLGIIRLRHEMAAAGDGTSPGIVAEFYCEGMELV